MGLVGGASASLVGQTIIVPFDVISQHLMILGTVTNKVSTKRERVVVRPTYPRKKI